MICHEKIDYQLYFVKLNFSDGSREMTIKDLKNTDSEQSLLNELSCFFEELLKDSPEQWFFWRQSDQLFEENINEK